MGGGYFIYTIWVFRGVSLFLPNKHQLAYKISKFYFDPLISHLTLSHVYSRNPASNKYARFTSASSVEALTYLLYTDDGAELLDWV